MGMEACSWYDEEQTTMNYLVFNWKMNPGTRSDADKLMRAVIKSGKKKNVIVAPPFAYLERIKKMIQKTSIALGAQNVAFSQPSGGMLTGEVSASMLSDFGVEYVIIGHSERRYQLGEDDVHVRGKVEMVQKAGMVPVVCVGERHNMSFSRAKQAVIRQLFAGLKNASPRKKLIVAYEPVWAIGGDKDVSPSRAVRMIMEIQTWLDRRVKKNVPVLYGGSVHADNADDFLAHRCVKGLLVGSASLNPKEVSALVEKVR